MASSQSAHASLLCLILACLSGYGGAITAIGADEQSFRVATYNLQNYLLESKPYRPAKSAKGRRHVQETLLSLRADVLALQELGTTNALLALRDTLKSDGLDYPHWQHVRAYDTNIHLGVLSRFPFTRRRPHTNDHFVLTGRRRQVARGFAEVTVRPTPDYRFTLIAAHLKSKRPVYYADQAELRREEARLLRRKIDAHLVRNPHANLIVLGDFNDHIHSDPLKLIEGRGKRSLIDTRPQERYCLRGKSSAASNPTSSAPIAWTHFYDRGESYTRIDYIFTSRGMAREWLPEHSYIPRRPNWAMASDHRPLVATFVARDQ